MVALNLRPHGQARSRVKNGALALPIESDWRGTESHGRSSVTLTRECQVQSRPLGGQRPPAANVEPHRRPYSPPLARVNEGTSLLPRTGTGDPCIGHRDGASPLTFSRGLRPRDSQGLVLAMLSQGEPAPPAAPLSPWLARGSGRTLDSHSPARLAGGHPSDNAQGIIRS